MGNTHAEFTGAGITDGPGLKPGSTLPSPAGSGRSSKRFKTSRLSGSYISEPSINDNDVDAEVDRVVIVDSIEHDTMPHDDTGTDDELSETTVDRVSDDSTEKINGTLSSSSRSLPCKGLGEEAVTTRSGRHSIRPLAYWLGEKIIFHPGRMEQSSAKKSLKIRHGHRVLARRDFERKNRRPHMTRRSRGRLKTV